jgi:hypothetical protein
MKTWSSESTAQLVTDVLTVKHTQQKSTSNQMTYKERHIPPTSVSMVHFFPPFTTLGGGEEDLYGISTHAPIVMKDKLSDFQDIDHFIRISYQDLFFLRQLLYSHKYKISFSP